MPHHSCLLQILARERKAPNEGLHHEALFQRLLVNCVLLLPVLLLLVLLRGLGGPCVCWMLGGSSAGAFFLCALLLSPLL